MGATMRCQRRFTFGLCCVFGLALAPPLQAQDEPDYAAQLVEAAALSDMLTQYDILNRQAEELTFWMAMALMGEERGWTFIYSTENELSYAYQLESTFDDAELAAVRAAQAIARNSAGREDQMANVG